jgi:cellulose 1,4-beta-cellobiosidase
MGNTTFYGSNTLNQQYNIDTSRPITVVTQFITSDNSDNGTLSQIKRIYIQGGTIISNANSDVPGVPNQNWIDDNWCTAQKQAFQDPNTFGVENGLTAISNSMKAGHVLILSIWDDSEVYMNWLDSIDPSNATYPYAAGVERGTCQPSAGVPGTVQTQHANASVTFSDIKYGPIGSTYSHSGS